MNAHLNKILKTDGEDYVVAMDTDSMYLNLGPFVKCILQGREKTDEEIVNFLDKVCAMELEPFIESSYQTLAEYVNAYEQEDEDEARRTSLVADSGTAKKRYALNVWTARVLDTSNLNSRYVALRQHDPPLHNTSETSCIRHIRSSSTKQMTI